VIEEAAGITRFKTRKRLAEAKLEGAKQNLARVYDIFGRGDAADQFAQAAGPEARRYVELKADLESRLKVVLSGKYGCWSAMPQDRHRSEPGGGGVQGPGRAGGGTGAGA